MKALVWLLGIFLAAVASALLLKLGRGSVLIFYPPYGVEVSLALAGIILAACFLAFYSAARLSLRAVRLSETVRGFRAARRQIKAREAMIEGIRAFFEGRYGKAEKAAAEALALGEAPALNALIAARAAHRMRAFERRDGWIAKAEQFGEETARLMTHAELHVDAHDFESAYASLTKLKQSGPRHLAALRLMLRVAQAQRNWDEVLRLSAQLDKRAALPAEQVRQLRLTAHLENLRRKALDAPALAEYWKRIPERDRIGASLATHAARMFIHLGGCRTANEIIAASLAAQWTPELVELYSECMSSETLAQIEQAERWLPEHPRDAELLLSLGRLCTQRDLWGKAQSYLEASLAVRPTRRSHLELARLFDRLGRTDEANRHYRMSADIALRV